MTNASATSGASPARIRNVGLLVVAGAFVGLMAVLTRVWLLQYAPSPELVEHVNGRSARMVVDMPRGDLLDRQGRLLAASRFVWQTIVDPTLVPDPPDKWIAELTSALDDESVAERVFEAIIRNEQLASTAGPEARISADQAGVQTINTADAPAGVLGGLLSRFGVESEDLLTTVQAATADKPKVPARRYLPVGKLLERAEADKVVAARLPGVSLERRSVRVTDGDPDLASIVGKVGFGNKGLLGVERSLDDRLAGSPSTLRAVHDARGRPLWIESGSLQPGRRGTDIRLSFDRVLQQMAREELDRGVLDADAAGGRLIAVDPETGELLAMVDILREIPDAVEVPWRPAEPEESDPDPDRREAWREVTGGSVRPRFRVAKLDERREIHPALGRNRCLEDVYEPGSTFKSFVWSSAFEAGLLKGDGITTSQAGYRTPYGRRIVDVTHKTELTWDEVLLHSSNIGMVKISEMMTHEQLREIVVRFGFGRRTGLPLPGESPGIVTSPKSWDKYTQTSIAMGYEVAVTPVQMVRAFSSLARNGEEAGTMPELTLTAVDSDTYTSVVERVLQPETVVHARRVLAGVVDRMDAQKRRRYPEDPERTFSLFGKSGTAKVPMTPPAGMRRPRGAPGYYDKQYNSSFIAAGPVEHPEIVVLVVIDDPGPSMVRRNEYYGSSVAGPVVRRFAERALVYLGAEPDLLTDEAKKETPLAAMAE